MAINQVHQGILEKRPVIALECERIRGQVLVYPPTKAPMTNKQTNLVSNRT